MLAAILIITGTILLNPVNTELKWSSTVPTLLAMGSGIVFGLMQVGFKVSLARTSATTINFYRLLFAILISICVPDIWKAIVSQPLESYFWAFICAFLGPFGGRLAYTNCLKYLPISKSSLTTALIPILAGIYQWLFLDLPIHANQIPGSALLLAGVCWLIFTSMRKSSS